MDFKDKIDLESIIFEKDITTVEYLTQKISSKYGIELFDLECEIYEDK